MVPQEPKDRLREARLSAGLSRKQLASRLSIAESTVRAHETGQNNIKPIIATQYADALGVGPAWLLYGEREAVPPIVPTRSDIRYIPVVGEVFDGAFVQPLQSREREELALIFPDFQRVTLTAYAVRNRNEEDQFRHYVITAPVDQVGAYAIDDVILRRVEGGKEEIGQWRVGAEGGWTVFYRGDYQSKADELVKVRRGQRDDRLEVLGVVVGRFSLIRRRALWGRVEVSI